MTLISLTNITEVFGVIVLAIGVAVFEVGVVATITKVCKVPHVH